MADDTRQSDAQKTPDHPRGPANTMPGGSAHTAGGYVNSEDHDLTYFEVVRRLGPDYYLNFHKRPCVRDSQLNGIAAGFMGLGVGAILRKPVMMCCNYAVFTWVGVSCASYQYCQYWRSKEKDGIRQMNDLMAKKRASVEAKREARRKAKEEQDRLTEERRKEEERKRTWSYWFNKNVKFW
ncbi:hypothetical protein CC78DRAFT_531846 [Lojkania enalia]|uniref:Cytochrome c oxidase assembly protein COX20, mitochondrial n=1 Tax=Lojkania enalia TaxID=147567 RepID=A0A9P4N5J1_9PLEO|nr:hypothetical protein CC78DRAFT_531846 [Didymosphaeria enalia]